MNSTVTKKERPTLRGKIRAIPKIDDTLTKEGFCADAKAVGDALRNEQRAVNFAYEGDGLKAKTIQEALDELKGNADELNDIKAPSGYGLGTHATGLANVDLNDVTKVGFYCFDAGVGVENAPTSLPSIFTVKPFYNESYAEQECILIDGKGTKLRRIRHNGVWQPWEYENPPMTLWEEYRTTERWMGKPVYTKMVSAKYDHDIGNAGGSYSFAIEFSTPNFHRLVRYNGCIDGANQYGQSNTQVLPFHNQNDGSMGASYMNMGGLALAIERHVIPANTEFFIQLWYTKLTD